MNSFTDFQFWPFLNSKWSFRRFSWIMSKNISVSWSNLYAINNHSTVWFAHAHGNLNASIPMSLQMAMLWRK
jgi:hypothetical protein